MKFLLLVLASISIAMAAGGDTVRLSSAYKNIEDGDTIYTWWWKSPVDSIKKVVNGRIGNINIASDARISFQKLDSTGYLKARRVNCDTLVCDTLRASKKISCDTLSSAKIDNSRYILSDSAAIRSLSGKSNTSIQVWAPQIHSGWFEGDFRSTGGANINLLDTLIDTTRSGIITADSIYTGTLRAAWPMVKAGMRMSPVDTLTFGNSTITMYDSARYFKTNDSIMAKKIRGDIASDSLRVSALFTPPTDTFSLAFNNFSATTRTNFRYTKTTLPDDTLQTRIDLFIKGFVGTSSGNQFMSTTAMPAAVRPKYAPGGAYYSVYRNVAALNNGVVRSAWLVLDSLGYVTLSNDSTTSKIPTTAGAYGPWHDSGTKGIFDCIISYVITKR